MRGPFFWPLTYRVVVSHLPLNPWIDAWSLSRELKAFKLFRDSPRFFLCHIMYYPQPSPIGTPSQDLWAGTPQPAPAPYVGSNPVAPSGSTLWNQAWTSGYGNSTGQNPYTGQNVGGYDIGAGFLQGQQQYQADYARTHQTTTTPTGGTTTTTTPPQLPSAPDFSSLYPSVDEINSQYQTNIDYLNQQLAGLAPAQAEDTTALQNSYNLANQSLTNQQQNALGQTKTQQGVIAENRDSAIRMARNLYNQLSQSGISRFGAGSSTGPSYSEIVGRSTSQAMGNAATSYQNAYAQIAEAQNQINQQYQLGSQTIQNDYTNNLAQLQRQYRENADRISYEKGQTEQAKQSAQLENLRAIRTQAFNFQQQRDAYLQQLNLWSIQNQASVNSTAAKILGGVMPADKVNQNIQNIVKPISDLGTQFSKPTQTATSYTNPYANIQGYLDLSNPKKKEELFPYVA